MPPGILAGIVALVVAVQTVDTRACSPPTPENPAPATPTPTAPLNETFTTADGVRLTVETLVTSLEIPWSMAFAPDGRLFVTERPGRVRILDIDARTSELALTLDDVFAQGEAGLLGLALDPRFSENRLIYLYESARLPGGGEVNRVVRYREAGSRLAERAVLLDGIPAAPIHDGGRLRFGRIRDVVAGPDGYLYFCTNNRDGRGSPTSTDDRIARLVPAT